MEGLLSIVLMFVIFYFLVIRPQNKKEKQIREMRVNLRKGDEIITIGGIHGKIFNIHDDVLTIAVGKDKVKLKIARWAIAELINKEDKKEDKIANQEKNPEVHQEIQESNNEDDLQGQDNKISNQEENNKEE